MDDEPPRSSGKKIRGKVPFAILPRYILLAYYLGIMKVEYVVI